MKFESFKAWLNEKENQLSFTDPELDYSELFRLFNYFNNKLPDYIDKSVFNKEKYYTELISKKENDDLQEKFNIKNALQIKNKIDKKWHPLVDYIYEVFKNGKKTEENVNFLNNVYFGEDYKKNDQSFHNFIENPKYLEEIKEKEPKLYKEYYKESFEWFDKNTDKIPTPVIIKIGNRYHLVGGNRRLCWLLSKGTKKITVWLI